VPCFRQRDVLAASRWAHRQGVPLVFDPLISAYDKQVFERRKYQPDSRAARRLRLQEMRQFQSADLVLADTPAHAEYFEHEFSLPRDRVSVVYVGAEEPLFHAAPMPAHDGGRPLEVLFYGSFIGLQAPQLIVQAARRYRGPAVRWTLLGDGPLRAECERLAQGLPEVRFENPIPYEHVPARIHAADIVLGVFDAGAKAGRVIPNKVFQALACGRPVITRQTEAYPLKGLSLDEGGLVMIEAGRADILASKIAELATHPERLEPMGLGARAYFEANFSRKRIKAMLDQAMREHPPQGHA
jgi:glycosyltransferase involved in cell wall biosynthesis